MPPRARRGQPLGPVREGSAVSRGKTVIIPYIVMSPQTIEKGEGCDKGEACVCEREGKGWGK